MTSSFNEFLAGGFMMFTILLFAGNFCYEKLTSLFLNDKVKWYLHLIAAALMPIVVIVTMLMFFAADQVIRYKPPPPINLVFWGIDKSEFNDYHKLNDFIKVTNSRVVLFGAAVNDDAPIQNVIASIPVTEIGDYKSIRTWYVYNKDDERKWHGVAAFGIPIAMPIVQNIYANASESSFDHARNEFVAGDKGVFESKTDTGLLCNFTTQNSTVHSERRPLNKASKEFMGL